MSKKDKEEKFKDLWKEILKETRTNTKELEKEMVRDTKKQLLKIIEGITTANDLREFLIRCVKVLLRDYGLLTTLLNEDKENNEN